MLIRFILALASQGTNCIHKRPLLICRLCRLQSVTMQSKLGDATVLAECIDHLISNLTGIFDSIGSATILSRTGRAHMRAVGLMDPLGPRCFVRTCQPPAGADGLLIPADSMRVKPLVQFRRWTPVTE